MMRALSSFEGFTKDTPVFLQELSMHNYRSWFEDNRDRYILTLRNPFESLAHDTYGLIAKKHDNLSLFLHVSRIYRDARRLFGRGPYKDHVWFSIKPFPDRNDGAALYYEIGPFGWSSGLGFWGQSPSVMAALRKYIDSHENALSKELTKLTKQTYFSVGGEYYARTKGHADDKLGSLYNAKSVWIGHEEKYSDDFFSSDLPFMIALHFEALLPLYIMFSEALALNEEGTKPSISNEAF